RRSAFTVFLLPAISLETDATKSLPAFFNFGTLRPETYSVQASVTLRYDLFTGGQKVAELARSAAALDGANAGALQARFAAALLTEADYYAVLAGGGLTRVARARARRPRSSEPNTGSRAPTSAPPPPFFDRSWATTCRTPA